MNPTVASIIESSQREYEKRSVLEMELAASLEVDHITTAFRHFTEYVTFETSQQKKSTSSVNRVVCLFERFALRFKDLADFWHAYYRYVSESITLPKSLLTVSSRSLRHVSNCGPLYEDRLLALESAGRGVSSFGEIISTALSQCLGSYYEYLHFLLMALAAYRHAFEKRESDAEAALMSFCGNCVDWMVGVMMVVYAERTE